MEAVILSGEDGRFSLLGHDPTLASSA